MNSPDDPSKEQGERDSMAGLGLEVGDELRDLRHSPAEETDHAQPKRYLAAQVADAIVEVLVDPSDAGLLLLGARSHCEILRHLSWGWRWVEGGCGC